MPEEKKKLSEKKLSEKKRTPRETPKFQVSGQRTMPDDEKKLSEKKMPCATLPAVGPSTTSKRPILRLVMVLFGFGFGWFSS